jgi:hypothetical protein
MLRQAQQRLTSHQAINLGPGDGKSVNDSMKYFDQILLEMNILFLVEKSLANINCLLVCPHGVHAGNELQNNSESLYSTYIHIF